MSSREPSAAETLPATALLTAARTASFYPVDRKTYDQSIELLSRAIRKTKLGIRDKNGALGRLNKLRRKL